MLLAGPRSGVSATGQLPTGTRAFRLIVAARSLGGYASNKARRCSCQSGAWQTSSHLGNLASWGTVNAAGNYDLGWHDFCFLSGALVDTYSNFYVWPIAGPATNGQYHWNLYLSLSTTPGSVKFACFS